MMEFHTIFVFVVHYGYDAVMEFIVDIGDHFVSHYLFIVGPGAVHCVVVVVKRVRKRHTGQ